MERREEHEFCIRQACFDDVVQTEGIVVMKEQCRVEEIGNDRLVASKAYPVVTRRMIQDRRSHRISSVHVLYYMPKSWNDIQPFLFIIVNNWTRLPLPSTVPGDRLKGLHGVLCTSFCRVVANLQTAMISFAILSIVFITECASLFLRLTFSLLPPLRTHVSITQHPHLRGAVQRYCYQ